MVRFQLKKLLAVLLLFPLLALDLNAVERQKSVEVSKTTFERRSAGLGRWRGYLRGNGPVHLQLQLYDGRKKLLLRKYMGNVLLTQADGPIPFVFESRIPKGSPFKWVIHVMETPT